MTVSREEAIEAYNQRTKQCVSAKIDRAASIATRHRVEIAKYANEVLQLDGYDEIVWHELAVRVIGGTAVYSFTACGQSFIGYRREREYPIELEESPYILEMKVAEWAHLKPFRDRLFESGPAFVSYGYQIVGSIASLGEAILIAELEALMPDRRESKNYAINTEFVISAPGCTNLTEYERIFALYTAEKESQRPKGIQCVPVVAKSSWLPWRS